MKKLAFVLLALTMMTSCAHKHACKCGEGEKPAACASCKTDSASGEQTCNCKK